MLPDVFHPEEPTPGKFGPHGVTIISRSGAILYHMSDALASVGIAQNAVLGVGGDGAQGATFRTLVPMAMAFEGTDAVVVAGEIGGMQEELLAADMKENPIKYPKPLIALISGKHAPSGKTMGHAGAIVSPGSAFGTWQSKRDALTDAGVTVVNNQDDLRRVVSEKLGKKYFDTTRYYGKMKTTWEAPPSAPSWGTVITEIKPNAISISGYKLQDIIASYKTLLETTHLCLKGEFPNDSQLEKMTSAFHQGLSIAPPALSSHSLPGEDLSKTLAKSFLTDDDLALYPQAGSNGPIAKTAFAMGRSLRYLAATYGTGDAIEISVKKSESYGFALYRAITGAQEEILNEKQVKLVESLVVACIDHGVTPPSAQATLIASSVRAAYEVSVASGIAAITDVHGGAGAKAAQFFQKVIETLNELGDAKNLVAESPKKLEEATKISMKEFISKGIRIEGMGHRVHTQDPRREVLWKMIEEGGKSGLHVAVSRIVEGVFAEVRGMKLPINVDGVIGAIIADLGFKPSVAKAVFVLGRISGLSAHYFEEIASQSQMRKIVFADCVYKGKPARSLN